MATIEEEQQTREGQRPEEEEATLEEAAATTSGDAAEPDVPLPTPAEAMYEAATAKHLEVIDKWGMAAPKSLARSARLAKQGGFPLAPGPPKPAAEQVPRSLHQDMEEVVALYQAAHKAGSVEAAGTLGQLYSADSEFQDTDEEMAYQYTLIAAEAGDAYAQENCGTMHANGQGVPRDDATALAWYMKAAAQENTVYARIAEYNIGAFYESGRAVEQDRATAFKYCTSSRASRGPHPATDGWHYGIRSAQPGGHVPERPRCWAVVRVGS